MGSSHPGARRCAPILSVALLLACSCVSAPIGAGPHPSERLAAVLSQERDVTDEALARDLRALSLESPGHVPTLVADAAQSIETGRVARATALLDAALDREPDHVDAVLLATRVATRSGDLAGARRRVEAALRLRPDAAELHGAEASIHYVEGRHVEALAALDRADALAGGVTWRTAFHRGLIAEGRGDLGAARTHFAEANELEPDFEPAARRLRWLEASGAKDRRNARTGGTRP